MSEKTTPDFTNMSERDMITYLCYESKHTATTEFVKDCLHGHESSFHGKKSVPPPKNTKTPINKERIIWIIAMGIAAAISAAMKIA